MIQRYPEGKTQEATTAFKALGGTYSRVYSQKLYPKSGTYQRVKMWGARERDLAKAKEAFEAAGFTNVRYLPPQRAICSWCGIAADYALPKVTA